MDEEDRRAGAGLLEIKPGAVRGVRVWHEHLHYHHKVGGHKIDDGETMERRSGGNGALRSGHRTCARPRRAPGTRLPGFARGECGRSAATEARVRRRPERLSPRHAEVQMSDPALLSLAEARSVPPRELLKACRARIELWQPRLNAFIEVDENPRGGGVPLAHKDMFYRAGRVSSCGSKIRRDWVANETAAVLERLDAAGFGDLGRLNMSEFAYGPTGHNEHFGDCKNPWNPEYVTGGSSSGSGAAVAARLVFGALGSDTGGSVRIPAAACGVTAIKPTQHAVSTFGVMPLSPSLDCVGFLAQTSRDCARLLSVVSGPDVHDPACLATRPRNYEVGLDRALTAADIIFVPDFPSDAPLTDEVRALVEQAASDLADAGATLRRVLLPSLAE